MIAAPLRAKLEAYERGELHEADTYAMFQELVRTGLAWRLPACYRVTIGRLCHVGLLDTADTLAAREA